MEQLELIVIQLGLGVAATFGLSNLQVFSDAMTIVSNTRSPKFPANEDGFTIEELRNLSLDLNNFKYMYRSCNNVAYVIA